MPVDAIGSKWMRKVAVRVLCWDNYCNILLFLVQNIGFVAIFCNRWSPILVATRAWPPMIFIAISCYFWSKTLNCCLGLYREVSEARGTPRVANFPKAPVKLVKRVAIEPACKVHQEIGFVARATSFDSPSQAFPTSRESPHVRQLS